MGQEILESGFHELATHPAKRPFKGHAELPVEHIRFVVDCGCVRWSTSDRAIRITGGAQAWQCIVPTFISNEPLISNVFHTTTPNLVCAPF
eukprot:4358611-Amphidinium_carterae.2